MEDEHEKITMSEIEKEMLLEEIKAGIPLMQSMAVEIARVVGTYYIEFKKNPLIDDTDIPSMAVHAAIYYMGKK
ncbi:hypothetical protein [Listeria booriae]|uniref:hypothetical protein n=1 Tax=Listeria booriae TaxID=1552123 RepID=UPI0016234A53|nr:hypothetical protein [Listeria booriae]MBC1290600.1 hypothetical protein [Listeria booriae]